MKFRVWMILDPPSKPITIEVETIREVCIVFDTMVAIRNDLNYRDLFICDADVSGLEYEDLGSNDEETGWSEFFDKDGNDIEYYYDLWTCQYQNSKPEIFNQRLEDIVER